MPVPSTTVVVPAQPRRRAAAARPRGAEHARAERLLAQAAHGLRRRHLLPGRRRRRDDLEPRGGAHLRLPRRRHHRSPCRGAHAGPGTRAELRAAHSEALSGQRVERFDSWHERRDGTLVPVNVSAVPLRDEARGRWWPWRRRWPTSASASGLARSWSGRTSRLQRQNAALVRSNRDLEQFAYVASHDLSEPLRVMTGYVDRIEQRYTDLLDDRGRRYMRHIVDGERCGCARSSTTCSTTRASCARRRASGLRAPTRWSTASCAMLEPSPRGAAQRCRWTSCRTSWSDASQLDSLLANLISNAAKFAQPRPAPCVRGQRVGGGRLGDAGRRRQRHRHPPEYRERVFRMFQRLHVREAYPGRASGWPSPSRSSRSHGGRIWIEDSPLGGARVLLHAAAGAGGRP